MIITTMHPTTVVFMKEAQILHLAQTLVICLLVLRLAVRPPTVVKEAQTLLICLLVLRLAVRPPTVLKEAPTKPLICGLVLRLVVSPCPPTVGPRQSNLVSKVDTHQSKEALLLQILVPDLQLFHQTHIGYGVTLEVNFLHPNNNLIISMA
jgi:hypothetical protein